MANKKMTQKYWDALEEGSRFRALKKVFSNFPDTVNHDYAKQKAKDMGCIWKVVQREVKQTESDHYKTCIGHTYIP